MLSITSLSNPLVKEIKALYRKKARVKNRNFIIEGIKIIDEAISNHYPLKNILYTDRMLKTRDGEDFFKKIGNLSNLVYVSENVFKDISDTENPQGVLAVAEYEDRSLEDIGDKDKLFLLFLDELQDPGNMGTIIRSGDAFNIDGIVLGKGSVDPYNPKVVRSTMGSIFRVPLYFCDSSLEFLEELKKKGFDIITTSLEGEGLGEGLLGDKTIVIVGNEANGVKKDIIDLSNGRIKIPMPGQAESLNAGVAASIIMYEAMKTRGP